MKPSAAVRWAIVGIVLGAGFQARDARATLHHYPGGFASLQEAFNTCEEGDTLLIAPGVYSQPQHRRVDYSGPGFTVLSEAGPEDTVFDCGFADYWLQLSGAGSASQRMVLAGITVRNYRDFEVIASLACTETVLTLDTMVFRDNPDNYFGTGASFSDGDIQCIGCVFRECNEVGLILVRSTYDVSGCLFMNNSGGSSGGGAEFSNCTGAVRDSQFIDNVATRGGGLALKLGGSAELDGLLFGGNQSGTWGGGLEASLYGEVTLRNSVFVDNRAWYWGGGVAFLGSWDVDDRLIVENCDFVDNWAQRWGSAITAYSSAELHVTDCSFVGNETEDTFPNIGAAILCALWSPFYMERTIVAGTRRGVGIRIGDPDTVSIQCSNVWGNADGNFDNIDDPTGLDGNISLDPLFCGTVGGDSLALMNTSPCLPANNACGVLMGNHGQGCETVRTESRSWGSIKSLY